MTKLRHGEISSLAKLGQVAELKFDPGSVAPESEFLTAQLFCLSCCFIETVYDSLIIITVTILVVI